MSPKNSVSHASALIAGCVATAAKASLVCTTVRLDRGDRPRAPQASSKRRCCRYGESSVVAPDWIGAELGIPPRTVGAILARHGVPHLADCDPLTGQVIRASRQTAQRYERSRPGELVHM